MIATPPLAVRPRKPARNRPTPEPVSFTIGKRAAAGLAALDREVAEHGAPADLVGAEEQLLALGRQLHGAMGLPDVLFKPATAIYSSLVLAFDRWKGYRPLPPNVRDLAAFRASRAGAR